MTAPKPLPRCPYPGCNSEPERGGSPPACYVDCPCSGVLTHTISVYGRTQAEADARWRRLAGGPEAPPPPSDAVREAAEVVRTILTAHDARLSESGVLTYGPPSKGTGFVAAIQWLRRYDAARGGE